MELKEGRPEDLSGRCEEERYVYEVLDRLNISYVHTDHEPAMTMELCRQVDEIVAPAVICKNLFLCNTQKTNLYLLLLRSDARFRTSSISKQLNSSRLSFADEEMMRSILRTPAGSLGILSLLFDKKKQVHLAVDREVLQAEWFACHPCRNTTTLRMKTKDVFEVLLPYLGIDYEIVQA